MRVFQNYHRHSMYTNPKISDSTVTNEAYATRAADLHHGIISSCEHGYQGRYIETVQLARQYSLKPLIGAEAYWVRDRFEKDGTNCHIFLGAKNEHGRQALNDILSEANITGFYRQARVDLPLLFSLPSEDIIVTTACIAFWKYEDADRIVADLFRHFGKNFFLEVQYHNTESQKRLNERILELHNRLKIPLIMGCDSHYITPNQAQVRDDFLVSKGLVYEDEDGWYLDYPDGDTAYQRFAEQSVLSHSEICDAMDNTNVFLEVEPYDSPVFTTDIKMPSLYPEWTQEQKDTEYQRQVWAGWSTYKEQVPEEKWPLYESEIQKEIDIVLKTKMADYFLCNQKIIQQGISNGGNLTKTGRGSAVSFITNKLLGFTEVDRVSSPVRMYPERFMSAERILKAGTLPDIDFNVANVAPFALAQQQVLGEDHAMPMIAFGTLQKSAAWKLYAKSQNVPFDVANEVSNQIKKFERASKARDEDEEELNILDFIDPQYHEIFMSSKDYLNMISSWSIAPSAYLLYQGSIRREIGLIKVKDNLCCLMDGHWAEEGHFLKNDLLKVSVVDLIYRTYHRLGREPPSVNELIANCPADDPAWSMYAKQCTLGLNQVEQVGTSARVAKYKPTSISELCAFVAAIRPGFASMYKVFENRQKFSYGIKVFDDLIQTPEMPNSFVLYQEMEMAALHYAGIPMSDCYTAIKDIAKKRAEKVLSYKETFINGFARAIMEDEGGSQSHAEELAHQLWKIIEDSSRYSFNASHSYCVSCDSLYCAYLKAHYPLAFYETLLIISEEKGKKERMAAVKEEAESYFSIKFPPFRYGQDNRMINYDEENWSIVNSISSIKGYSSSAGDILYECGQSHFTRFMDVLRWLSQRSFKAAKVKPLLSIGYFDVFGNIPTLNRLVDLFDLLKQGEAKKLPTKMATAAFLNVAGSFVTNIGTKGTALKSYTILDMDGLLKALEDYVIGLRLPDLTFREKASNQLDVLGYIDLTTGRQEDLKKLYVMDLYALEDRYRGGIWKYKIKTKSIGSGKVSSLDINPRLYEQRPIQKGDVIYLAEFYRDKKGYFQLCDYQLMTS